MTTTKEEWEGPLKKVSKPPKVSFVGMTLRRPPALAEPPAGI